MRQRVQGQASALDAELRPLMDELVAILARLTRRDGVHPTSRQGVSIFRSASLSESVCSVYEPSLVLVAQGAKEAILGGEHYVYDEAHYLVAAVDVPVSSRVTRATHQHPYLCLTLRIDLARLTQLVSRVGPPNTPLGSPARALAVSRVSQEILNATLRLARLLENPDGLDILAPLVEEEILYRLLIGEQGARLRRIAAVGHPSHQIARAIDWMKQNYNEPLRIDDLARRAHMSTSSLHHHFKAVTTLSPLQFHKQIRLQEARRLMFAERLDAASASQKVGYESPSHFSRDYSRQFGAPPSRDIAQLRQRWG